MANVDTQPEVIPEPVHLRRDTGPESHSDIPVSPEVHNNGQDLNQDSFASQSTTIAGPILPTTRTKTQGDSDDPFGAPASTSRSRWEMATLKEYFYEELDLDAAAIPLSAYCFMTGFTDAISFTACYIWCAFQTGNTIQLSLALARLFSGPNTKTGFQISDRQALVSLAAFLGGSFLGRIGDRRVLGGKGKSRGWLSIATLLQAGFTLAASMCALTSHESGFAGTRAEPSWTDARGFLALAFASASMGLQALIGTRLGSHFATTVVLTSIWVQFISDPTLFRLKHVYKQRDFKALAIFSLFLGGLVGRALTGTIGPAAALGIGAGVRVFIALTWLVVPRKGGKWREALSGHFGTKHVVGAEKI